MEKFDYKVLECKSTGLLSGTTWFDKDENVGPEMNTALLSRFGEEGWEVATAMQHQDGATHKIILKRRRS